jgi:hypothetical protein
MVSRIYMKNILLFIGFISLGLTTAAKIQTTLIIADHPYIQYIGRFDFTDKSQPVFMYSGCMIRAAFTGTSLVIRLKDDSLRNWFTVKMDDSIFIFKANNQTGIYQLTANLTDKKHTVELSRRTEWHGGNSTFMGFIIDQGTTLLPLKKYKRSIEFIGNSITCGYGNEGESNKEHFEYATENNYLSATSLCQPLYPPSIRITSCRFVQARLNRMAWAVTSQGSVSYSHSDSDIFCTLVLTKKVVRML